ncbi:terminase [Sphingomonas sp. AR_OL41]|uniref:terminase n=1 Tax=Sphingomonas sp. AR_OL41 TaxID=3042729 RepID=UPI00248130E9|nr:terminase [Sphingomonas sp. AR_OL41]MDH7973698.1 terminase [Sphingomonas sp. AR_OL41]
MADPDPEYEAELIADMDALQHDPLGHALYAYPWGEGPLANVTGPRTWQREVLATIGAHLQNPATRHMPCRIARASGHGIGKSALIAMIVKWALDTFENTRVMVTANTETQLRTKTGPEIAKWSRLSMTSHWFKPTATALISTEPDAAAHWRMDLETWSANNTEAFQGLHNEGKRLVLIFDEASGIAAKVWEVALGALTDADTEIIWIAFGNPTQNTGGFRECFARHRALWNTAQIDSRTVEGTNKAYLDELVATYGVDSDIVRVRVLGQFPNASSMQFISSAAVADARRREIPQGLPSDPVIFGVDCARYGDDHSTLAIRCSRDARSRPWKRWHGVDAMTLAGDIAVEAERWKPDAIFVDAGNIGAAVIDRLRQLMPDTFIAEVWFGSTKVREANWQGDARVSVANKRAEMWTNMRHWLGNGAIPDEQAIEDDLIGPEYGFNADQAVLLEEKKHMKSRGLASPDDADALACTFAEPVQPRKLPAFMDTWRVKSGSSDGDLYAELGD